MKRFVPILAALLFVQVGLVEGQQPAARCLRPTMDVEELMDRLLEFADAENHGAIPGAFAGAVAPYHENLCPSLGHLTDEELDEVLAQLVAFAFGSPQHPSLVRGAELGILFAVSPGAERSRYARPVPLAALASIIEESGTEPGRYSALRVLLSLAEIPVVHEYLLEQARAEIGPPAWLILPAIIVAHVYEISELLPGYYPELRSALESDPPLIRNDVARCVFERQRRPPDPNAIPCGPS